MTIKSRPTVDTRADAARWRMKQEMSREIEASKELHARRRAAGLVGKREGRIGAKSRLAVLNAIRTEGKEVMTEAGECFWKDMARRYPWQNPDGVAEGTDSPNGHVNRLGKVSERYTASRGWEHWDPASGDWVPGEITKRKGIF